jgi:hypothetical protein
MTHRPPATMTNADQALERLRYPLGRFHAKPALTGEDRSALIDEIAALPGKLRAALSGLTREQLDTPYRAGGWTLRQVVHHLPDSHANAYIRFKRAATEHEPEVTGYDEAAWAELPDGRGEDVETSLILLDALHRRWAFFLRSLPAAGFARAYRHPEMGPVALDTAVQLYAWHGRHHVAHVTGLRERRGW